MDWSVLVIVAESFGIIWFTREMQTMREEYRIDTPKQAARLADLEERIARQRARHDQLTQGEL